MRIDIGRASRKEKEAQGLFSFLPKIEVLSRAMWNSPPCKNFLKRQAERVCSLMGVQLNGCAALRVCSLLGVQPCLERFHRASVMGTDPTCVGLDKRQEQTSVRV